MTVTVKHSKTNAISDWTQAQLDEQIALGNFAEGTVLADIVLPSDWNNDHTLTGVGTMAEQDANSVAITGGTATLSSVTTPSVTATTNNLTLSAISTGVVNLNTALGNQVQVSNIGDGTRPLQLNGGLSGTNSGITSFGGMSLSAGSGGGNAISFYSNGRNTTQQFSITHTASAVNYVQVTGAATTALPTISAQGSDAGIALAIQAKGGSPVIFQNSSSQRALRVDCTGAGVNYFNIVSSAASQAPIFSIAAASSDTNVSMAFQPKGTGAINLAAGSSGVNISNGGTVTAVTRTAAGTGYTSVPTVNITAPTTAGGVQAVVTIPSIVLASPGLASGGTGYTVGNVLTLSGGTFTTAATITVTSVSAGVITGVSISNNGVYTVAPAIPASVTGGTGTGATFNASFGINSNFSIGTAGSGYIEQPTITFSGGGGSGASAYATVGGTPQIKGLGSLLNFYVANQNIALQLEDLGGTGTAYWKFRPGNGSVNPIMISSAAGGQIATSGTSPLIFQTSSSTAQFYIAHTASAVNYVQVTGGATLNPPVISSQGSDSTIAMIFQAKGGQNFRFFSAAGSAEQFRVIHTAGTIANYAQATGNVAGSAPSFSVNGSDTNIDLSLTPKGTGLVRFGTYTAGALTATGYINIKAADGTTYKVLVST